MPIAELDLTSGVKDALTLAGVLTVGDLRRVESDRLLDLANSYPRVRDEIFRLMAMRHHRL
jgi:DNA-directed RNA polymerase alpha subunit